MSGNEFSHNHYVPEWYQRNFMHPGEGKYFYLDLKPAIVVRDGHQYVRRNIMPWGPSKCFAENDLYTVKWGNWRNTDIEKFFFGALDNKGPAAARYFAEFVHPSVDGPKFQDLMNYMSVQKLRTPKGLLWLRHISRSRNKSLDLLFLQRIQNIYCALWTECVWQIANADDSPTKFIISDHPVTAYNRALPPGSNYGSGLNDADIRMVATHTYFPLRRDRILIMTNLSWVRNPYQRETAIRPNPRMMRDAMFNFTDIQTHRNLSEQEVLQINFITKSQAFRYVAAADKSWLFPEQKLKPQKWAKIGHGILLMPDPRDIYMGGEMLIGYNDGRSAAFSEYGHRPWQKGFKDTRRFEVESKALDRFKAEFAVTHGPQHRGSSFGFHQLGPERDSPDFFQHYVDLVEGAKRKPRVQRRRRNSFRQQ